MKKKKVEVKVKGRNNRGKAKTRIGTNLAKFPNRLGRNNNFNVLAKMKEKPSRRRRDKRSV